MTQLPEKTKTIIDELLEEQHLLTAVTRFAQKHDDKDNALHDRLYRDLIPLAQPQPGEQYAFEVDLDKCSGCKACVAACHNLNGLEADESWRSVGLLVTSDAEAPFQQTVTTACHHCVDPACLNGCPVLAYEKDRATGIVRHLDDQCIGCQYCVLKCPYEVPRYSSRLGIVRKCDMCHNRLSAGEAPACAQSCPSEAIRITVVDKAIIASEYLNSGASERFLPASPHPGYTIPATRYIANKPVPPNVRAADEQQLKPAPAHWPLVFMLVLTQAGIGGLWFTLTKGEGGRAGQLLASNILILAGLFASILHLGRPLQAWRAFIGVRRSWLSREIIAFGALAPFALLLLAMEAFSFPLPQMMPLLSALAGAVSLCCSMMVYIDTPREFWRWHQTGPRFLGTTILLGLALQVLFQGGPTYLYAIISVVAGTKFVVELNVLRHLAAEKQTALKRTALLLTRQLMPLMLVRFALLLFGGVALAQFCFARGGGDGAFVPMLMFISLFVAEFLERLLFFRAVSQPVMPGGVA